MDRRFYLPDPIADDVATLTGTEAHHLLHVLRAQPGEEVILFDGRGREFRARVARRRRAEADLQILQSREVDRESPINVTLAAPLPKGERQRWLVEKLVELGVTTLVPLSTERSVATAGTGTLARLRRAVIEASKQCGRNRLMHVQPARTLEAFLRAAPAAAARWLADPSGQPVPARLPGQDAEVWLAIGPEGGFTDREQQLARQLNWELVSLGPRVLRIETAALVLATLVTQRSTGSES